MTEKMCGECKHITKTIERVHDCEYWYDDVILRCNNKNSKYYTHRMEHMDNCEWFETEIESEE